MGRKPLLTCGFPCNRSASVPDRRTTRLGTTPGVQPLDGGLLMVSKPLNTDAVPLPLVRLVREVVDASGLSIKDFAHARALPYSTLRRYTDRTLQPLSQPPRPDTLRQLALALDVPLSKVQRAADASVGRLYDRVVNPNAQAIIASANEMTEQEIEATVTELQRLLEELREGGGEP